MSVSRHRISLGALAVVLCLAFPMGVLSLLSPATTGDQVDAAHSILVARVEAMQVLPQNNTTVLELSVDHFVAGEPGKQSQTLVVDGWPAVEVGDDVLAVLETNPSAVLGVYQIEKDQQTLQYQVISPISGMWSEGISDYPPVSLNRLELAIKVRRGMLDASVLNQPEDDGNTSNLTGDDVQPDDAEPNDTLATAQPIFLDAPHLITGTPLCITGLTLTPNDVDFFSFDGAALSILHVETRPPSGLTYVPASLTDIDTFLGLFDAGGTLLGFDDDGGLGKFSRFSTPLELNTGYAVAVESAPDTDLDFTGDEGLTTGPYDLKLELEKAAYLTNFSELIVGVSMDGTFIEDFIGFKQIGGEDVLTAGVQIDGWGMSYNVLTPAGQTFVKSGAGSFAGDPGFIGPAPMPDAFVLGPLVDAAGFNRSGFAKASQFVTYLTVPRRGIRLTNAYRLSLFDDTVRSIVELGVVATSKANDIKYARIMDVDIFGVGADHFYWNFDPAMPMRCFPVDASLNVGDFLDGPTGTESPNGGGGGQPSQGVGDDTGDFQLAMIIDHGDLDVSEGFMQTLNYPAAYTMVTDTSEAAAVAAATANLVAAGMTTYCIAVDVDGGGGSLGDGGTYVAYGAGLGPRDF